MSAAIASPVLLLLAIPGLLFSQSLVCFPPRPQLFFKAVRNSVLLDACGMSPSLYQQLQETQGMNNLEETFFAEFLVFNPRCLSMKGSQGNLSVFFLWLVIN